jgi:tetratricopeptide (TPR) repeat protein
MNKKAKRAYDKAMDCYEKGKINKALEICEEILSEGLDNSSVLNFKGLLLYQRGNLNEAVTVWKINQDLNNDEIARNYIRDSEADEKRIELYKQGERELKQLNIDKALELFKICAESDFNAIKVSTGIGMCYQKKGDFYRAKEYIDKALGIDQSAVTAGVIQKELKENGIYLETKDSSNRFLIGVTSLFIIIVIAAGGYLVMAKLKNKDFSQVIEQVKSAGATEDDSKTVENKEVGKSQENQETKPEEIVKEETQNKKIDAEKLKTLMASNDLDGVYEQLKNVKAESVSREDSEVYNKAIKLMKSEGTSKFYDYGLWYFNQGNYTDAGISFDKAHTYCEGNAYKEHVLFYRASNSLKKADEKTALKQYEEYYSKYPKGVYTEESLYELALLTNSIDKEMSKKYANTLMNKFPQSIYVNDKLAGIARS